MRILGVLTRVYLRPDSLEGTIVFYENLFGESCQLRFFYPAMNLELARVENILMIAGPEDVLEALKETRSTFLVDDLDSFEQHLEQCGAQILSRPKVVPTGRNMRVQHPDGLVVEYVEHF